MNILSDFTKCIWILRRMDDKNCNDETSIYKYIEDFEKVYDENLPINKTLDNKLIRTIKAEDVIIVLFAGKKNPSIRGNVDVYYKKGKKLYIASGNYIDGDLDIKFLNDHLHFLDDISMFCGHNMGNYSYTAYINYKYNPDLEIMHSCEYQGHAGHLNRGEIKASFYAHLIYKMTLPSDIHSSDVKTKYFALRCAENVIFRLNPDTNELEHYTGDNWIECKGVWAEVTSCINTDLIPIFPEEADRTITNSKIKILIDLFKENIDKSEYPYIYDKNSAPPMHKKENKSPKGYNNERGGVMQRINALEKKSLNLLKYSYETDYEDDEADYGNIIPYGEITFSSYNLDGEIRIFHYIPEKGADGESDNPNLMLHFSVWDASGPSRIGVDFYETISENHIAYTFILLDEIIKIPLPTINDFPGINFGKLIIADRNDRKQGVDFIIYLDESDEDNYLCININGDNVYKLREFFARTYLRITNPKKMVENVDLTINRLHSLRKNDVAAIRFSKKDDKNCMNAQVIVYYRDKKNLYAAKGGTRKGINPDILNEYLHCFDPDSGFDEIYMGLGNFLYVNKPDYPLLDEVLHQYKTKRELGKSFFNDIAKALRKL